MLLKRKQKKTQRSKNRYFNKTKTVEKRNKKEAILYISLSLSNGKQIFKYFLDVLIYRFASFYQVLSSRLQMSTLLFYETQ